jgi:acyl-CoA synthetase (AMP-forming)/AMP-acid ligase II
VGNVTASSSHTGEEQRGRVDASPSSTSLWSALEERRGSAIYLSKLVNERPVDLSWDDLRRRAHQSAGALARLGVEPGDRVACIFTNTAEACIAVWGIWLAGATVVSLPTIARGMAADSYVAQLRKIVAAVGAHLLLVGDEFLGVVDPGSLDVQLVGYGQLRGTGRVRGSPPEDDQVVFIQYSSGSTSQPKGCMLSARAIAWQLDRAGEAMGLDGACDRGVAWVPLSHDMGMFACFLATHRFGMPFLLTTPQRFLKSPRTWLRDCSETGATITLGPSFALDLAVRACSVAPPGPLKLRNCVLSAERVDPRTLQTAADALAPYGLTADRFVVSYGLAEAVLEVTCTERSMPPRAVFVDADQSHDEVYEQESAEAGMAVVSCGKPLEDSSVRIDGENFGEILVRSPSLASGYVGDPQLTRERFVDGELRTGDLGFIHDGELYVRGRLDDMLAIGGRNVFARDVEALAGGEVAIRPGSCVLLDASEYGSPALRVLAEPAKGVEDMSPIALGLAEYARRATGFRVKQCLILAPGTLPKTPSGKVQRHRCQELVRDRGMSVLAAASA